MIQFPWPEIKLRILLVDLWSGIAGTALALLSMGCVFYAVAAEEDTEATRCASACMPNIIHVQHVESMSPDMLASFLARRQNLDAILVGGGSPCQPNSSQNTARRGLADPRAHGPATMAKLVQDIEKTAEVPVLRFLENVASMPPSVCQYYSELLRCDPVYVNADRCGYVTRARFLWGNGPQGAVGGSRSVAPPDWIFQQCRRPSIARHHALLELSYIGGKPLPARVHLQDGFQLGITPSEVVQNQGENSIYTFAREFRHPSDRIGSASVEAGLRFWEDECRFSPPAYEEHSLAWKGDKWRQYLPEERAQMHGIPADLIAVKVATSRPAEEEALRVRAKKNSLVGNGFHVPCVAAFLFCLLSTVRAQEIPVSVRCLEEQQLRGRINGSIFQPGAVEHWAPMTPAAVVEDLRQMFEAFPIADEVYLRVQHELRPGDVHSMRFFPGFMAQRGQAFMELGNHIPSRQERARLLAPEGKQRAPANSKFGLDHVLPAGMDKNAHIAEAIKLPSPFVVGPPQDPDVAFAASAMATFGPLLGNFRVAQQAALLRCQAALQPLEAALVPHRCQAADKVARERKPAMFAFLTSTQQWPDRQQPACYVSGFQLVDQVEPSWVWRPIVDKEYHAAAATSVPDHDQALRSLLARGPPRHAEDIAEITRDEIQRGFADEEATAEELDNRFGPGQWRALSRFLVVQGDGKKRVIDNAKDGGQNVLTEMLETIYMHGVDFVPAVVTAIMHYVNAQFLYATTVPEFLQALHQLVPWLQLVISTDDLPDAYRGCPVRDSDLGLGVVAVWSAEAGRQTDRQTDRPGSWRFVVQYGLGYGYKSAVTNFNRSPALMVAVARRVFAACASHYFDDIQVVDFAAAGGRAALRSVMAAMGYEASDKKGFPPAQQRHLLGAFVNVGTAVETAQVVISPKESTRHEVISALQQAIEQRQLTPGDASTLRGKQGWLAAHSAARIGALGARFLSKRQYAEHSALDQNDIEWLRFIANIVDRVGPRSVPIFGDPDPPVVLYTDASFEPGQPIRLGWVVFKPGWQPRGWSCVVPEQQVALWKQRRTQIFPAEVFAVALALVVAEPYFLDSDVLVFIDNEAAVASLVKGNSAEPDIEEMVRRVHWDCYVNSTRAWFEWVDTAANPADGLSRAGVEDEWTKSQGWILSDTPFPSHRFFH